MTVRPRRSVLYMPGSNPRALEKGRSLTADALILDLEDAVAPDAKVGARDIIKAALAEKAAYGRRELVVRVNGLDTAWGEGDLVAMAETTADAILLPKVESAAMVQEAADTLDGADVLIWSTESEAEQAALLADPVVADLRATKQNRNVLTTKDLAGAIAFASPLSYPVVADQLPALLSRALG